MKKGSLRILITVFCMILMIWHIGTGEAGKKEEGSPLYNDKIGGFFGSEWFYVKDSVPEDLLYQCEVKSYLFSYKGGSTEECEKIDVKFASGSKHLKEAIKIRSDEKGRKSFYVDNDVLTEPGEAVFRLSAESEHYQWNENYYLNVIDYNEYPLLEVKTNKPVLEVSVGDCFESKDLSEKLLAAIADVHLCEIHEKLKNQIPEKYRLYDLEDDDPLFFYSPADHGTLYRNDMGRRNFIYEHYENYISHYEVVDYGVYRGEETRYRWGNVELKVPQITIQTEAGIAGKGIVRPGEVVAYHIDRAESKVSWSVEGDNVRIHSDHINSVSEKNGTVMAIDADAEYGSEITITATDERGNQFSKKVTVSSLFDEKDLIPNERSLNGFKWHYPVKGFMDDDDWNYARYTEKLKKPLFSPVLYRASNSIYDALYEDTDKARAFLEGFVDLFVDPNVVKDFKDKWIEIDGHPAYIIIFKEGDSTDGELYYLRNSLILNLGILSDNPNNPVEFYDFEVLAKHISYDETAAPFTVADAALSISTKGDQKTVTAGRNISFAYAFANPDRVNKKNKNDAVVWSVTKAETGEAVEGVTIDAKGQLKVDKSMAAPVDLQVKVASEKLGTSATYNISAMPVVSKVVLEPAELFFYVGTEDPQTVKVSLEPATVPPVGLTWTPAKKDIVEITAVEDGTVSIKPLKAGKTDIAVKEPGGKNAKLTVNVVAPVESVELKANGAAKAGGKVKIAATLSPKNVGNKTVQWSVDVGEDIAKIDDKGQLTISKEAPSGTKITVTCTAVGAPSPVVSTIVVEIS